MDNTIASQPFFKPFLDADNSLDASSMRVAYVCSPLNTQEDWHELDSLLDRLTPGELNVPKRKEGAGEPFNILMLSGFRVVDPSNDARIHRLQRMGGYVTESLVCFTNHMGAEVRRKKLMHPDPAARSHWGEIHCGCVQEVVLPTTNELKSHSSKDLIFYNCQLPHKEDDWNVNPNLFFRAVARQLKNEKVALVGGYFPYSKTHYTMTMGKENSEYKKLNMLGANTLSLLNVKAQHQDITVVSRSPTSSLRLHSVTLLNRKKKIAESSGKVADVCITDKFTAAPRNNADTMNTLPTKLCGENAESNEASQKSSMMQNDADPSTTDKSNEACPDEQKETVTRESSERVVEPPRTESTANLLATEVSENVADPPTPDQSNEARKQSKGATSVSLTS